MRLSEWRKKAPLADAASDDVMAIIEPILVDLGAQADADCWVIWGEDPGTKYSILAPALAGLISIAVRPLGSIEGPRATGKLTRWSKLSVTELGVEAAGGHRIVAVQVESYVLKGVDDEADRICEFVRGIVAGVENRIPQQVIAPVAVGPLAVAAPGVMSGVAAAGAPAPRRVAAVSGAKEPVDGKAAPKTVPTTTPAGRPSRAKGGPRVVREVTAAPIAVEAAPQPAEPASPVPAAAVAAVPEAAAAVGAATAVAGAGTGSAAQAPSDTAGTSAGPKPISSRSAAHQDTGPDVPPAREDWVSPHTIAVPHSRPKAKPRRWTP